MAAGCLHLRELSRPAESFTGDVYIDPIAAPEVSSTFGVSAVHFTPGAGTAGHRHTHGKSVAPDGMDLLWSLAHVHGGPAPVRRFLPELIDLIWNRRIGPGSVFEVQLPLDEAADAYRAMDRREAIKVLLRP